jgi:hypothetical protein
MSTQPPRMFRGHFNEIIGSGPFVWDDADVRNITPHAQEQVQTQPVTKERVWFPLPDEPRPEGTRTSPANYFQIPDANGNVPPSQYKRPAPKPKPPGYRWFVIPTDNEGK